MQISLPGAVVPKLAFTVPPFGSYMEFLLIQIVIICRMNKYICFFFSQKDCIFFKEKPPQNIIFPFDVS